MKLLRPIESRDLDLMYIIENDIRLWSSSSSSVPFSRETLSNYISTQQSDIFIDRQVRFAIGDYGFLDLTDFDPLHHRAQIGIVVSHEFQGRGFALQALNEAADYARSVQIHNLWAVVSICNRPAIGLFQRAGYQLTGTLTDWLCIQGTYTDALHYQLTL